MTALGSACRSTASIVDPDGILREVGFDIGESPLAWLFSRRDKNGEAMISADEFAAGERLRRDYTLAEFLARTTMNWDSLGGRTERRSGGSGVDLSATAIDARARVAAVVGALGPDLSSVAIDVCCHLAGLADVERLHRWPQRSGKVVLRLALAALARHYGIDAEARGTDHVTGRHWGSADYRPSIRR